MNRMVNSIAILGCAALVGAAAITYAEEPQEGDDGGQIITVNFIGERSSAVALHYKVAENDDSLRSAIALLESLSRKMAEQGFERLFADDDWQEAAHDYSVFIVSDAVYSKTTRAVERREGHLMALVVEDGKLAVVNGIPAEGAELAYRQIERMADEIVRLLISHSFI